MVVDHLKSCYTTTVRLRVDPELLATIRWYWAPPGALPLPTPTAFGSMVWDTDWFSDDLGDLGETSLTRTWDRGAAPFGVTGQGTPTPLGWFLTGVPSDVDVGASTWPTCPGALPSGPLIWLRPEEIAPLPTGAPLWTWPPAPPTTYPGDGKPPGQDVLKVGTDTVLGVNFADLYNRPFPDPGTVLVLPSEIPIGPDYTFYLVGLATPGTPEPGGPLVEGHLNNTILLLNGPGFAFFKGGIGPLLSYTDGFSISQLHFWRVRVTGNNHVIVDRADGAPCLWTNLLDNNANTWSGPTIREFATSLGADTNDFYLYETILWPRALSAAELSVIDEYLFSRYFPGGPFNIGCDMLIGGCVLDFGGDAVPPLWLQCNGQAVSRSTYALLFARIGIRYGAGDGSTTFNLPDATKGTFYGAGGVYQMPNSYGNDSPTLNANQLPAHTHPVSDPGHKHTPSTTPSDASTIFTSPGRGTWQMSSGTQILLGSGTAVDPTGLTVGNNATIGQALDVRQLGIATRVLMFAGVAGGT